MTSPTDWTISMAPGAICRTIMWQGKEVALVNPRGDFDDNTEQGLAAGFAHAGKMHSLLGALAKYVKRDAPLPDHMWQQIDVLLANVETIDVGHYQEPDL